MSETVRRQSPIRVPQHDEPATVATTRRQSPARRIADDDEGITHVDRAAASSREAKTHAVVTVPQRRAGEGTLVVREPPRLDKAEIATLAGRLEEEQGISGDAAKAMIVQEHNANFRHQQALAVQSEIHSLLSDVKASGLDMVVALQGARGQISDLTKGLNRALQVNQRAGLETAETLARPAITHEEIASLSQMKTAFEGGKATIALKENQAQHAAVLARLQREHAAELSEQGRTHAARMEEAQSKLQKTTEAANEQNAKAMQGMQDQLKAMADAQLDGDRKTALITFLAATNLVQAGAPGALQSLITATELAVSVGGPAALLVQKILNSPAVQRLEGAKAMIARVFPGSGAGSSGKK